MNNLKYFTMAIGLLISVITIAQPPRDAEKLKAEKTAYIKKRLALTAAEEKSFLPAYEKFMDEYMAFQKDGMLMMKDYDLTFADDAEAEKMAQKVLAYKQKEADILKRHYTEFKKVLPAKKAAMVFKVEYDFKHEMLKGMRGSRRGGPPSED